MKNVGIVIVSHSPKIAEGTADMVRQMVGEEVPLAWCGGNPDGGLGTQVGAIIEAIDRAWSEAGFAILAEAFARLRRDGGGRGAGRGEVDHGDRRGARLPRRGAHAGDLRHLPRLRGLSPAPGRVGRCYRHDTGGVDERS